MHAIICFTLSLRSKLESHERKCYVSDAAYWLHLLLIAWESLFPASDTFQKSNLQAHSIHNECFSCHPAGEHHAWLGRWRPGLGRLPPLFPACILLIRTRNRLLRAWCSLIGFACCSATCLMFMWEMGFALIRHSAVEHRHGDIMGRES